MDDQVAKQSVEAECFSRTRVRGRNKNSEWREVAIELWRNE